MAAPAPTTRPGAATRLRRSVLRVRRAVRPLVTITGPPETGVRYEHDVEVRVRDGTVLRVNVFRPDGPGEFPVLMSAHPYSKDIRPAWRRGRWRVPFQFRMLPQSEPFSISAWTSWEAPDPSFWVPRGYVVVNADLRGWGRSDGEGELLSAEEGRDYHDLIEWAAAAPWSTGKVGLTGVSYLAITQWAAAAERPAHLAAINPWEGFTDLYRDFGRPGGIREDGFVRIWSRVLARQHRSPANLGREMARRPVIDDWWRDRNRDLEAIEVPALVCASFSDHCLHSRGSFEGFRRIGSPQRYLYTHRSPKWSAYYSAAGLDAQTRFFDRFLKGQGSGLDDRPPVRVEVRSDGRTVATVHHADTWPPAGVGWRTLLLDAAGSTAGDGAGTDRLVEDGGRPGGPAVPGVGVGVAAFDRRRAATFVHRFVETTDVVGPMWARLVVSVTNRDDAHCFVGVRKVRNGCTVGFEGSYGFTDDLVTHGMLRLALRGTDGGPDEWEPPWAPAHPSTSVEPMRRGVPATVDIELHASATRFEAGEELHLVVQGGWFFPTNPLFGQFPAHYRRGPAARCTLHTGDGIGAASALHLLAGPPLEGEVPRPQPRRGRR